MKGYRVFVQGKYGFETSEIIYTTNYNIAIHKFNDFLRRVIKENDVVEKDDFGEKVQDFKTYNPLDLLNKEDEESEIICRKCPFIIVKKGNRLTAIVYFWEKCSYEYDEWDIDAEEVRLEEIEILN